MKRALTLTLLVLVCLGAPRARLAAEEPRGAAKQFAALSWLEGTWESREKGESFRAHYGSPEGGVLLSASKGVQGGQARFFEFEVFRLEGAPGAQRVTLQPYPGGKPAASFVLTESSATERFALFSAPKNPFPSTIRYARAQDDRLVITLKGTQGGKPATVRYELKRVSPK